MSTRLFTNPYQADSEMTLKLPNTVVVSPVFWLFFFFLLLASRRKGGLLCEEISGDFTPTANNMTLCQSHHRSGPHPYNPGT